MVLPLMEATALVSSVSWLGCVGVGLSKNAVFTLALPADANRENDMICTIN